MSNIHYNQNIINNKYDIIIIDSGCNNEDIDAIYIHQVENRYKIDRNTKDNLNHGTFITNLINKNYKKNILMVKIIDNDNDIVSENHLIYVLNYIYKNLMCKLINISLGISVVSSKKLYNICKKIREKGIYITAAYNNDKSISYPAFYDCVLGVDCSFILKRNDEFIYLKNNPYINILAYGNIQRVSNEQIKSFSSVFGTSFACANFSRILYEIINIESDINYGIEKNAKMIFKCNDNEISYTPIDLKITKAKKIAVFPFSKENQNIFRLCKYMNVNIDNFYDFKESGKVNMNLNEIYKIPIYLKEFVIKNIEKINFQEFDTLVIGHINLYSEKLKNKLFKIIELCLKKNKRIISYDTLEIKNKLIFTPKLEKIKNIALLNGKLFKTCTPILLSTGTSSKEGKFTFQIKFKAYLNAHSYKVGYIGSEPNALLFDSNDCIHCGYNANLNSFTAREFIANINYRLHLLDSKFFDIIIVGAQANILSTNLYNVDNVQIENFNYFSAINPDIVVLNINYYDEIDYIKRSLAFMQSLNNCKVGGIVVYPLKNINNKNSIVLPDERKKILKKINQHLINIPIAFLDDDVQLEKVYENILSYFK